MEFSVDGEDGGAWGCHVMVEEGSGAPRMGVCSRQEEEARLSGGWCEDVEHIAALMVELRARKYKELRLMRVEHERKKTRERRRDGDRAHIFIEESSRRGGLGMGGGSLSRDQQ